MTDNMTDNMTDKMTDKMTELNANAESFVSDFLVKEKLFFDKLDAKFIKENPCFFE